MLSAVLTNTLSYLHLATLQALGALTPYPSKNLFIVPLLTGLYHISSYSHNLFRTVSVTSTLVQYLCTRLGAYPWSRVLLLSAVLMNTLSYLHIYIWQHGKL